MVIVLLVALILLIFANLLVNLSIANFLTKMGAVVSETRDQVDDLHVRIFGQELVPPQEGGLTEVATPQQTYDPRFVKPI